MAKRMTKTALLEAVKTHLADMRSLANGERGQINAQTVRNQCRSLERRLERSGDLPADDDSEEAEADE